MNELIVGMLAGGIGMYLVLRNKVAPNTNDIEKQQADVLNRMMMEKQAELNKEVDRQAKELALQYITESYKGVIAAFKEHSIINEKETK